MKSCRDIMEKICAYIDNELDAGEKSAFETHMRECPECRRELEEVSKVVKLCNELPAYELPPDFKAELHKKLTEVAADIKKDAKHPYGAIGLFRNKAFLSVAAGILAIFLVGGVVRFTLLSPATMGGNAAKSLESAAEELPEAEMADDMSKYAGIQAPSPDSGSRNNISGGAGAESTENLETDRSFSVKERQKAAASAYVAPTAETATARHAFVAITARDTGAATEAVRTLALENGGEAVKAFQYDAIDIQFNELGKSAISSGTPVPDQTGGQNGQNMEKSEGTGTGTDEGSSVYQGNAVNPGEAGIKKLAEVQEPVSPAGGSQTAGSGVDGVTVYYVFPADGYDAFIKAANNSFGEENVKVGAITAEDRTEKLKSLIEELERIEARLRDLRQESGEESMVEAEKLKKEKESLDKQIEFLRLVSDIINVTIQVNVK